jgi:chromosome segregation ATPase
MPSEVERVTMRVAKLETIVDSLKSGTVPSESSAPVVIQKEIVVDTSKYDELNEKVERSVGELDTKITEGLNDIQGRLGDLDHVKSLVSTVDGLTLHLELLHKRVDSINERVTQLEEDVSALKVKVTTVEEVDE